MNDEEIRAKLDHYETFLETKLKSDLKCVEEKLKAKASEFKDWEDVKNIVKHWKSIEQKDRDTNIQVEVGSGVAMFGEVTDYDRLYIDIGLGVLLEMDYEEADKYANIRLNLIRKEISHLRKLAVHVKVHIKMVLLAMNELQNTVNVKR